MEYSKFAALVVLGAMLACLVIGLMVGYALGYFSPERLKAACPTGDILEEVYFENGVVVERSTVKVFGGGECE